MKKKTILNLSPRGEGLKKPVPDVQPEKELAAETEISQRFHPEEATAQKVAPEVPTGSTYSTTITRRVSLTEDRILVRGPKAVIQLFRDYIEEKGFRNAWGAIEYLVLRDREREQLEKDANK